MNIDFEKENNRFVSRATAIIYNKDKSKVLISKVEDGRDYYLLPGGRIEFSEDSKTAVTREAKEELGFDIDFEICAIEEIFINNGDKKITGYYFCYKGIYNGEIKSDGFKCKDNDITTFYWVDVNDLDKYIIYPKSIKEIIRGNNFLLHVIEK